MTNGTIIDFNVQRLRLQHHAMTDFTAASNVAIPHIGSDTTFPDDEPSLVAALVIRLSARLGRSLDFFPSVLLDALGDLVAEADPTARLLYAWIDEPRSTDQEIIEAARQPAFRRSPPGTAGPLSQARVYRHRRFWRPGSLRLVEADQRRIMRLRQLPAREIAHDL